MKRRMIQLGLLLVLLSSGGAIVNVAVAWGGLLQYPSRHFTGREIDALQIAHERGYGRLLKGFVRDTGIAFSDHSFGVRYETIWFGSSFTLGDQEVRVGLPLIAFGANRSIDYNWNCGPFRTVEPIWPGFAINTMFYAAILWVLVFIPGKARQMLRRRRGQCPACAYPIGSSEVCTECGIAVQPRRGDRV